MKQYKLLKDLPNIKKGTISTRTTEGYLFKGVSFDILFYEKELEACKDWFEEVQSLTFGGKEVNIRAGKYESTTVIYCAEFSCSLLHLNILYKSILELTNWDVENGKFKVVEIDGIELPFENITIGCQTDRIDKLKEIIDTATKLMK